MGFHGSLRRKGSAMVALVPRKTPEQIARLRNTAALNLAVKSATPLTVPPLAVTRRNQPPSLETLVIPATRRNDTLFDRDGGIWKLGEVTVRGSFGALRLAKKYDPVVSQLYALKEICCGAKQAPSNILAVEVQQAWERVKGPRRPSRDTYGLPNREHTPWSREVMVQVALRSPIAPHFILKTEDRLFYVMPPLDGDGIDAINLFLNEAPQLMEMLAHSMGEHMAVQLGECHDNDVVHLDLKPDNVLVSRDGSLYLADFGHAQDGHITDKTVGTFGFMAPEVYKRKPYDGRAADMYSLGATLLHTLIDWAPAEDDELLLLLRETEISAAGLEMYVNRATSNFREWYGAYERWQRNGARGPMCFADSLVNDALEEYDAAFNDARRMAPTLFPVIMQLVNPDATKRPTAEQAIAALRRVGETFSQLSLHKFRQTWRKLERKNGATFEEPASRVAPSLHRSASAETLRT